MIIRSYQCLDCNQYFEVDHDSGEEPEPPCPYCDVVLVWRPKSFAILGNKSKAMDITQDILENDYGISNFKDNTRDGETTLITAPPTTAERDEKARLADEIRQFAATSTEPGNPALQSTIKQFFGGGGNVASSIDVGQALAASRTGPGAYSREHNPMTMLHKSGKAGLLPNNMRVIAKA